MKCLVTGASRGIGWAIAQRLAHEGHSVILSARNADLLNERLIELPKVLDGQSHSALPLDLADPGLKFDIKEPVEAFIHSAGVAGMGLLSTLSPQSVANTVQVNLNAPIMLTKALVRPMMRQKTGSIIYLSSCLASKGLTGSSVYSATKAGLEGFTRAMAREIGSRGITVNCIAPGLTDTDMGRGADQGLATASNVFPGLIDPTSIADTVMFLLHNRNITGQVLNVDNGFTA